MRRKSIIAGVLAWLFLLSMLFATSATPHWLDKITFGGFIILTLASLILSLIERDRLGFWVGAMAMVIMLFFLVCAILR